MSFFSLLDIFKTKKSKSASETKISESEGSEKSVFENSELSRWDWRNLTENFDGVGFNSETTRSIMNRAYHAWCTNPLAGQIVNLTTWFVMGRGIGFTSKDSRVQSVLNKFWHDESNDIDNLQQWMSNELQIYGEIFIRMFKNPFDGSVQIRLLDPMEIVDIVTDPDDYLKPVAYLREYKADPNVKKRLSNFRKGGFSDSDFFSTDTKREVIYSDEIIHVKVNNVSNGLRGISELYRVLPWLDALDRWLRDRMAINQARGAFAYLRKVPANPADIAGPFKSDSRGKYIPPKPGSILVVHDGETWEVLSPKIGADDAKEDGRALKLMVAAGSGIFEHYFGDPSTGNLATTRSMELPMVKKFENRQRLFEGVFRKLFGIVIDSAIDAGVIPSDIDKSIEVNFPPIVPDDVAGLTETLIAQVESGLLSKESARRLIPWIGDPEIEAEKITDENKRSRKS